MTSKQPDCTICLVEIGGYELSHPHQLSSQRAPQTRKLLSMVLHTAIDDRMAIA